MMAGAVLSGAFFAVLAERLEVFSFACDLVGERDFLRETPFEIGTTLELDLGGVISFRDVEESVSLVLRLGGLVSFLAAVSRRLR